MLEIKIIKPNHSLVKEYIAYYYFMQSNVANNKIQFVYYPNYLDALNIFHQAELKIATQKFEVKYNPENTISSVLTCNKVLFKKAYIYGKYDIIGVVFNPLGIHRFLKLDQAPSLKKPELILTNELKTDILHGIFKQDLLRQRVELLDDFFIKNYRVFDQLKLQEIIKFMLSYKGDVKVQDLEQQFKVNRRTILRWFHKYLYCSVTDFKNIVKFRMAIDAYKGSKMSLTSLAYDNNYYDQSDFINHFKNLTGETPRKLFKQISKQERDHPFWKSEYL